MSEPLFDLSHILLALVLSFLSGFTASLLGIGGGVFMVPVLHLILGLHIRAAIGTSLSAILLSSAVASLLYLHYRLARWRTSLTLGLCGVLGSFVGTSLCYYLPVHVLRYLFSGLLLYTAYRMWRRGRSTPESTPSTSTQVVEKSSGRRFLIPLLGFSAGLASGLLGIGGGVVIVPGLVLLLNYTPKVAVATSVLTIVINAGTGTLFHTLHGGVSPHYVLTVAPSMAAGSFLAPRVLRKVPSTLLRKIFAVVIAGTAIKMVLST